MLWLLLLWWLHLCHNRGGYSCNCSVCLVGRAAAETERTAHDKVTIAIFLAIVVVVVVADCCYCCHNQYSAPRRSRVQGLGTKGARVARAQLAPRRLTLFSERTRAAVVVVDSAAGARAAARAAGGVTIGMRTTSIGQRRQRQRRRRCHRREFRNGLTDRRL